MNSVATTGKGTRLGFSDSATATGSGVTWLAELKQAPLPKISSGMVDTDLLAGDWSQMVEDGTKSLESVTASANWTETQWATLLALVGVRKYWILEFPTGATFLFQAVLTEMGGGDITRKTLIPHPITLVPTGSLIGSSGSPYVFTL